MKKRTLTISLWILFFVSANAGGDIKNFYGINKPSRYATPLFAYNFFRADFYKWNFSEFTELGENSLAILTGYNPTLGGEFGVTFFNAFYTGVNFGFIGFDSSDNKKYKDDWLRYRVFSNNIGLNVGYQLIRSRYLIFTPKTNVQWNRMRFRSNPMENPIPLGEYLTNKDLDLRFNQFTGFAGADLGFRLYDRTFRGNITLNILGGYLYKLHNKPLVYSAGNRLSTNNRIQIANYTFGLGFTFLFY